MSADIDIDFPDRDKVLEVIKHINARQSRDESRLHNTGIYVTDIPFDPIHNCAAIDYKEAEERGYFKLDFLNVSVYKLVKDNTHYQRMLAKEPNWSRLWQDDEWASQLVHIGSYSNLLKDMKPDSIPRMAAFISIIRPGKAHLQNKSWEEVFKSVWDGDDSKGFVFKKAHAISYSALVALHMNLLEDITSSELT